MMPCQSFFPKRWRLTRKVKGVSQIDTKNPQSKSDDLRRPNVAVEEESSVKEKAKSQ